MDKFRIRAPFITDRLIGRAFMALGLAGIFLALWLAFTSGKCRDECAIAGWPSGKIVISSDWGCFCTSEHAAEPLSGVAQ